MKKDSCKVSVIVPVYNAELYLDKCVRSVLAQTLEGLEIILVDDGSTDQSGSMCDAYAAQDVRVRVLHLENGGPARARNHGIELAQGTYIGFVDSDDYVESSMFERLYKTAEQTGSDIAMCSIAVDKAGAIRPIVMNYQPLYSGAEVKDGLLRRYYTGGTNGLNSMCNKLFRRSMIVRHSLKIDETLRRAEDAWFVFDCLKVANIVCFLPEVLYYYYQNPASIMHSLHVDQFEKWTRTRNRLLAENEQLGFALDWKLFYRDYLYKTVVFCKEMVRRRELGVVRSVFEDPVLLRAIPHRANLPTHIHALLWLIEYRHHNAAIIAFRLWNLGK